MNRSKFPLAIVLSALAALAFLFICFLGANFLNIGNDKVWGMSHTSGCVVMAVSIAMLLFSLAFGAKLLKRTSRKFKTCLIWEVVLLVLFVLFAAFFATKTSPFTHYFTVTARKSEINSKLQTSITQAENMFAAYESYAENRQNQYKDKLKSVAASQFHNPPEYSAYGFVDNGISADKQIENKMFTIHADLFPTNYNDTTANNGIKEVATEWLQNAKGITSSWKPIGIVGVVNDIDKNSGEWLSTLVKLSQVREKGEQAPDFEYTLLFDDVKTHFTKLDSPIPRSIGFGVLAYFVILIPYISAIRSTKSTYGFGALFRALFSKKTKNRGKYSIKYKH